MSETIAWVRVRALQWLVLILIGSAAGCGGDGSANPPVGRAQQPLQPFFVTLSNSSGAAGTNVVIMGAGFTGTTTVAFSNTVGPFSWPNASASFTVNNDSQITATVPLGSVTGPIRIDNPDGQAWTSTFAVQSSLPPTVTSFTPPAAGVGVPVSVNGTGFTGATEVSFGGVPAETFTLSSDGNLSATVPPGAVAGVITVTNTSGSDASAASLGLLPPPTFSGFAPPAQQAGLSVVLSGSGFTGATDVLFGGPGPGQSNVRAASFTVNNDAQITAFVPSGAIDGPIQVLAPGGPVLSPTSFTVQASGAPLIATLSPDYGGVDSFTIIVGSNFTGTTSVTFNGTPSVNYYVQDDASIAAYVPEGATTGPVEVTNSLGTAASPVPFDVTSAPILNAMSPTAGQPGTPVILTGMNLTGATSVHFGWGTGGEAVFSIDNDSQITATVPAGGGTGPIRVRTSGGEANTPGMFTMLASAPPTITSFDPPSGGPSTHVILLGSGFAGTVQVAFNGVPAGFEVLTGSALSAWVPMGASTGPIAVANTMGTATTAGPFAVTPPPFIMAFTPSSGAPGTPITITGAGFTGATEVMFSGEVDPLSGLPGVGVPALFTVNGDTDITATVPLGASSGPVRISTPGGTSLSVGQFDVLAGAVPVISGFFPAAGGAGSTVTISGSGFTGTTDVKFNGIGATFSLAEDGELRATVPAGATSGLIEVTNTMGSDTTAGPFTVVAPPAISGLSTSSAVAGTPVLIFGSNLTGATSVRFGVPSDPSMPPGTAATFTVDNDGQITATVPAGAGAGAIQVTTPGGSATSGAFTVLSSSLPDLVSFDPLSGGYGTVVTLEGTGFTGTTLVTFGGVPATFSLVDDEEMQATVPVGAQTGPIAVTNSLGSDSAGVFTVFVPPTISSFSPPGGAAGTPVVISGTGFTGATSVTFSMSENVGFGGTASGPGGPAGVLGVAATFTVDNDGQITAVVPPGSITGPVTVTTPYGSDSSTDDFYVDSTSAPTITSFAPQSGGPGTLVSILGMQFTGTTGVAFNGLAAQGFSLGGDGLAQAYVPEGATSGPITVTNTIGSANSAQTFTVPVPPSITTFSPGSGQPGTVVTITGTGFTGVYSVRFGGGFNDAPFSVDSDDTITTVVPPGAGFGSIQIQGPNGSAKSPNPFSVLSTSPPSIDGLSPASGYVGTRVTLQGSGFTGTTNVTFNGIGSWGFFIVSDTELQATVPGGAVTGPVAVTNTLGTTSSPGDFVVLPPPTIGGFTPTSGQVGDPVTITGSGFTGVQLVMFGGAWANFTVDDDNQITAYVPGDASTGPINVAGGLSSGSFTVLSSAAPVITSFSPTSGSEGSYTSIKGQNFTGTTAVSFNGTPSTDFWLENFDTLLAYVPAGATTGPISVTNTVGTVVSSTPFTIVPPPTFTAFSPPSGQPGDPVTITGTNLLGVSDVRFGGDVQAAFDVDSDVQITATVPVGAVTGNIVINNGVDSPTAFVVLSAAAPTLSSFSPLGGGTGVTVDIFGSALGGAIAVEFAGIPAAFGIRSDGWIEAKVPLGAGTGPITVTNNVGTAVSATNFQILPPPVISGFSPGSGSVGDTIVINGSGFTGTSLVQIGTVGLGHEATFNVIDDTRIDMVIPAVGSGGPIQIQTPRGQAVSSASLTVVSTGAPVITSFTPASGPIGTVIDLLGSNFAGVTSVTFGGVPATIFRADDDTTLRAAVPPGAVSGPIVVTNSAGVGSPPGIFTISGPSSLSITSVSPGAGPVGTLVTLTGTNLAGASVMFGFDTRATVLTNTGTTLTLTVPAGALTGPIVVFQDGGGGSGPGEIAVWDLFTVYIESCAAAPAGTPCDVCAVCNGAGACAAAAVDDSGCPVVDCDGLDNTCGDFQDVTATRCESALTCKDVPDCAALTAAPLGTPCGTCSACDGSGYCSTLTDGTACDDGNACTTSDVCTAGACTGSAVACAPPDDCHTAGTCNPATGACSNPVAPNGTPCDDANACTTGDTCAAGTCSGTAVVCGPTAVCHVAGTCNPATGACNSPAAPDGTVCSDGNACTTSDACVAGLCVGVAVVCNADACHGAGACDPATGACNRPTAPNGTPCDDGTACTSGETCQAGVCGAPLSVVTCSAVDQCHGVGACDPVTGTCTDPRLPNGTACDDGKSCTQNDTCQAGTCVPATNLCICTSNAQCPPLDGCQVQGICNLAVGLCVAQFVANGTPCNDADACTSGEMCQSGSCGSPTSVTSCPAPTECLAFAGCGSGTSCLFSTLADGTPCTGGACAAGTCIPDADAGAPDAGGAGSGGAPATGGASATGGSAAADAGGAAGGSAGTGGRDAGQGGGSGASSPDAGGAAGGSGAGQGGAGAGELPTGGGGGSGGSAGSPSIDGGAGAPFVAAQDDGGCGCRVPSQQGRGALPMAAGLVAIAIVARRRMRAGASSSVR